MRKTTVMDENRGTKTYVGLFAPLLILLLTCIIVLPQHTVFAANNTTQVLNLTSGGVTYTTLESTFFETQRWAGIKVIHNAIQLSEGTLPFLTSTITTPAVVEAAFPGANHDDESHYYVATQDSVFNISKLRNITASDLGAYRLFNVTDYPQFYTNWTNPLNDVYAGKSDNPNATFCCNLTTILVGAINITAYRIVLNYDYDYYIGKYDYNGKEVPVFIAPHQATICYNQTSCYAQFLLPISQNITWNFFSINKYGAFTFDVFVDGVQTTIISQTAKPYNITLRAYNLYASTVAPGTPVAIGERDGQNIFVPYRLSGFVSRAYSVGMTDTNGYETFIAAPTVYPTSANYSFFVSAIIGESITSVNDLSITNADQLVFSSKNITPQSVYDNAKTSVNAMNQINSFLFRWVSIREKAINITVAYDVAWNNYSVWREPGSNTDFQLQTGIPHIVTLVVLNASNATPTANYFGFLHEVGGYLIVNPYTDSSPLTDTMPHHSWRVPQRTPVIIVPTSLGTVSSNISLEIQGVGSRHVDTINTTVVPTLSVAVNGVNYSNDLLKTVVNAINQVLYSLYIALNT